MQMSIVICNIVIVRLLRNEPIEYRFKEIKNIIIKTLNNNDDAQLYIILLYRRLDFQYTPLNKLLKIEQTLLKTANYFNAFWLMMSKLDYSRS